VKVPLLDLRAQYRTIREDVERAVGEVLAEQQFVLGPRVERFEREMEAYTGAKHAIGVASGSDALLLALMALEIGPGDVVVTTPFSFFATASAPVRLGARLEFADIEPDGFDLSTRSVADALERTAAFARRVVLLPVHLFGLLAEMTKLRELARAAGARIVEDACQAIGARDDSRRMAGTLGEIGAYSFFPSKNLGGAGDGGMAVTDDPELARALRSLRTHGSTRRYEHDQVGINSRLDALQAAVLSVKLARLEEWNARRRHRALLYARLFRDLGLAERPVRIPDAAGERHVFHQYVIRAERRDALRAALAEDGIETQVYYPVPLHLQPCFAGLGGGRGDFPEAERAAGEVLALPMFPEISDDQVEAVVSAIARFYARGR
jgi:dTDP-4-amino-4,6-dideoxygalactose transaminase